MIKRKESFDRDWYFKKLDDNRIDFFSETDLTGYSKIDLPHDYMLEGDYNENNLSGRFGGFVAGGIGIYRKKFSISAPDSIVYIEFDGICENSEVYVNKQLCGKRPNGYVSFAYDITDKLTDGENEIAVKTDVSAMPNSRWYTGAGINRHTFLTIVNKTHIAYNGVCIESDFAGETAVTKVDIKLNNFSRTLTAKLTISDYNKNVVLLEKQNVFSENFSMDILIEDPVLWSPQNPYLYTADIELYDNGRMIDSYNVRFGIRFFSYDSKNGFVFNGETIKLKGVCNHEDGGLVGSAVPKGLIKKRLLLLKEMGCNAIRTAHNPFSPAFYDLCDETGMLVVNEFFDGWEKPKAKYDYGNHFEPWFKTDIKAIIERDRNHPCIIMWSIGNEVKGQTLSTTKLLYDLVKSLDGTRPITCGIQYTNSLHDECRDVLDIAGYNEGNGACYIYERDHETHPERVMLATECPHTHHTRGFYRTIGWCWTDNYEYENNENLTEEELFSNGDLFYLSSYDNAKLSFSARESWSVVERLPYLIGEFRWTGFDHYGESFGWPAKMNHCGVIDTANFKKDHFYLYQSIWTDNPMVHILPHWTHDNMEGVIIPVIAYTNCEEAELFLNGESLGREKYDPYEKYIRWDVPYSPGELKVMAYKNNKPAAQKSYKTAGAPHHIRLSADNRDFTADGNDICQVSFEICDKDDNFVPYADEPAGFIVNGDARLLGMDNGDNLDLNPPLRNCCNAFNGMGMGLVKAGEKGGSVEVVAVGVIGNKYFSDKQYIRIDIQKIVLKGTPFNDEYIVYYSKGGKDTYKAGVLYEGPILIDCDTELNVAVCKNGVPALSIRRNFIKGARPKVFGRSKNWRM